VLIEVNGMDIELFHNWHAMRALIGFALIALFVAGVVMIGAAREAFRTARARHSAKAMPERARVDPLEAAHA
jgi:hypothetical protein